MPRLRRLVVVALGGNAFLRAEEKGTIQEQKSNTVRICHQLLPLLQRDCDLVITHGNGPQVGNILIQNEEAGQLVPPMPLDVCVAKSEGSIGYILQQALLNELRRHKIPRYVVTMIVQVVVAKNDPAFRQPTKPIGPFFSAERARSLKKERGWQMFEDSGRGYRRTVPSPIPTRIIQRPMIHDLARAGHIVIAAGGGGIPIWEKANHDYEGIEAVIDKDLASGVLAREMRADMFIILTTVPKVYLNYGKKNQRALDRISLTEAQKYLKQGHFGIGSMAPKVEAAIQYLEKVNGTVIITTAERLKQVLANPEAGTYIYSDIKKTQDEGNLLLDL